MRILVTGGTGFVGHRLIKRLVSDGHSVRALGRRPVDIPGVSFHPWPAPQSEVAAEAVRDIEAVVHLAGEPVSQRWNEEVKRRIRDSRVQGTKSLVAALEKAGTPPRVMVSASAVGFYGDRGDEVLTESAGPGLGFLPAVTVDWESAALAARGLGTRVVPLRIGIVLGKGGALKKMLPPFRFGIGGPLGSGKQWMSWIHVDDLVELILFSLTLDRLNGPVNAVAPQPLRNVDFTRALAGAVQRPAFMPVPKLALSLLFGEMAGVMLSSQRVIPSAAESAKFPFRFPDVKGALADAVR